MCLIVQTDASYYGNVLGLQRTIQMKYRLGGVRLAQLEWIIAQKLPDLQLALLGQLSEISICGGNRLAILDGTVRARAVADESSPRNIDS